MISKLASSLFLLTGTACSNAQAANELPGQNPADPQMGDIGILASLDPVALDKACTDLVRASEDHGKIHLIERIDSRRANRAWQPTVRTGKVGLTIIKRKRL